MCEAQMLEQIGSEVLLEEGEGYRICSEANTIVDVNHIRGV
jgi:hypothetical protein